MKTSSLFSCSHKGCMRKLNESIDDFMQIKPCDHFICTGCAFKYVVNRKFTDPVCSYCKETSNKNVQWEAINYYPSHDQSAAERIDVTSHTFDLQKDPCRYYASLFDDARNMHHNGKEKFILSLSYPDTAKATEGQILPKSITTVLDENCGPETAEDEQNLSMIFALLHTPIMVQHKNLYGKKVFPRMTGSEFVDYVIYKDDSLLLKLLFAIGTGLSSLDMNLVEKSKSYQSELLAIAVAKEMFDNIKCGRPGPFQIMMADTLAISNTPKETRAFFSKLRVAASVTTMRNRSIRVQLEDANTKLKLGDLDGFSLHFDNVGFKGRKKKWSQHTIVQFALQPEDELRREGWYDADGNGPSYDQITFKDLAMDHGVDLDELKDCPVGQGAEVEALAKNIIGIQKSDKELVSRRTLTTISKAMELHLPTFVECQELQLNPQVVWPTPIPLNLGNYVDPPPKLTEDERNKRINEYASRTDTNISISINGKIPDNLHDCIDSINGDKNKETNTEKQKELFKQQATFYEMNNITLDEVMHEDPNQTKAVCMLMDYLEEVAKYPKDFDRTKSGGQLPVRELFAPATSDGAPMKRFLQIQSKDMKENGECGQKYKKSRIFSGGFHYFMELCNMRSRLVRDVFKFWASRWRSKPQQLEWILDLSDPTDFCHEMPQYLLAHYRSAFDSLKAMRPDGAELSPVDIHDHMVERAIQHPVCMAVLLDLRLLEIVFAMRDAEKSGKYGDVNLFLATTRLSLVIFMVTHATNYAHIACDFLEWHATASEAQKKYFERYLYTKLSPNGKPVWVDRGVEWTIRHVRMFLGKYARPNQNDLMDRVVPDIPFRVGAKRDLRAVMGIDSNMDVYSSVAWNQNKVQLSKVYIETYLANMESNLWGDGELDGEMELLNDNEEFNFIVDGEKTKMSSLFLEAFDIGERRALDYFIEWHIKNRYPTERKQTNEKMKLLEVHSL